MNPAIEQAVADAIPHTGITCRTGSCYCGAEKRRNSLLAKIALNSRGQYVYLGRR